MKKGFAPILIVLIVSLVILSAGAAYYFKLVPSSTKNVQTFQENAATKDWKPYSDPDLNISFKHPSDWQVYKEGSNVLYLHNYRGTGKPYDPANNQGQYLVTIDNATRPGSKNANELVDIEKKPVVTTLGGTYYYFNQKEFKVNNYDAFYVEESDKNHSYGLGEGKTYLLDGKGGGVIFSARPKEGAQKYITDIMSTVQFIVKPPESASITKEKTDNDNKSSYELKRIGTAVQACITNQLSKVVPTQTIYSIGTEGCGNKEYLVQNNLLDEKQTNNSTVHFLNNSSNTKICLYSENSTGNGIISWDSESGVTTEPGKSNSTSSCI